MGLPSLLLSGDAKARCSFFSGAAAVSLFLHLLYNLTSFSRQDWGEILGRPSPQLEPFFHFLFASFLAVFPIFAIWPGTVPMQFH